MTKRLAVILGLVMLAVALVAASPRRAQDTEGHERHVRGLVVGHG